MVQAWMESVAEAQRRAKRRLPPSVYSALLAGSDRGITTQENADAFGRLGLAPRVADLPPTRDLATTVLGQQISMPVLISPTGVQAVHPLGEVAMARAAATRGIAMGLSSFASMPIEAVIVANPKVFFQLYWMGSRDSISALMERARGAGAVGLILTVDWSFSYGRDWGSPLIPERVNLPAMLRFAPEAIRRPAWLWDFARSRRVPDLTVPNLAPAGQPAPTFFGAYRQWMQTPPPTWGDLAWLADQWAGPIMLKGICRVDDARHAVDAGFSAISVSNHGGNNLDTTPAAIRCLPAIADAVGDQVEVLLDGGIRRGSDVVKAVALGARAVMIGRACLWGLAAGGQGGVENVLDVLRMGMDATLYGLGRSSVHDLGQGDVLVPEGFACALGYPAHQR